MTINKQKMKDRLDQLKNPNKNSNKNILKLEDGETIVRILPTENGDPFASFYLHYGIGKEGSFLCPKANFGEKCAVCDFCSKLWNEGTEDSKKMARTLSKKQRFFSPVLVRGKEEDGPKVWSYSKTVYEFLLKEMLDPDNGDVTDPKNGLDLVLEYGKKSGKMFAETSPKFKKKTSPLLKEGTDKDIKATLNKIPDLNKLYVAKTSEEVKKLLDEHLNPKPEVESSPSEKGIETGSEEMSEVDKALAELQDQV